LKKFLARLVGFILSPLFVLFGAYLIINYLELGFEFRYIGLGVLYFIVLGLLFSLFKRVVARAYEAVFPTSQLKSIYGQAAGSLMANCNLQFIGAKDFETAKRISDMLGEHTIEVESQSDSTSKMESEYGSTGKTKSLTRRKLMTPDEIMEMGDRAVICFLSNIRPVLAEKIIYYQDSRLRNYADPNPFL